MTDRRADTRKLARGNRGADAGAADEDAALGLAGEDRLADLARLDRVVDPDRRRCRCPGRRRRVRASASSSSTRSRSFTPRWSNATATLYGSYVTEMDDVQLWRELGQQFRVDSVRCAAAAKSGHPTSGMSAADLMAVLAREVPALRLRRPGHGDERPAHLLQGPRVDAPLRDVPRRGRDLGRGAAHLPPVRERCSRGTRRRSSPGWTSPPARSARGCRSGSGWRSPASTSTGCRTGSGCCAGDSETAEGSIWEAFEHASALRARQPDRDPRRQPARPARPDDGRVAPRPVPRARRGVRLARDRDRRPRRRADRRRLRGGGRRRPAGRRSIIARTIKGKGVKAVENKEGWHGKPLDDPGGGDRGARRPAQHHRRGREARARRAARLRDRPARAAALRARLRDRDAQGLRRGTGGARLGARRRRRGRRRGLELDLRRDLQGGAPRPLLRDVHRRAADGRGGRRPPGARLARVRLDVRGLPLARLRLRPHGGDLAARRCACPARTPGVSIGEDGPSQMALEDLAMLRAVHGSTVLHPCDANQTAKLVAAMADLDGHLVHPHAARRTRR